MYFTKHLYFISYAKDATAIIMQKIFTNIIVLQPKYYCKRDGMPCNFSVQNVLITKILKLTSRIGFCLGGFDPWEMGDRTHLSRR